LTDVSAKVDIHEAFVEGRLEAPKHLYAREKAPVETIKSAHHPRALHVATHGEFAPDPRPTLDASTHFRSSEHPILLDDPMLRSALFFAGANRFRRHQPPLEGGAGISLFFLVMVIDVWVSVSR
jgi:hypothetical protein